MIPGTDDTSFYFDLRHFARPGPGLREGIAILARCAHDRNEEIVKKLKDVSFMPREGEAWTKVNFSSEDSLLDMEDVVATEENFAKPHGEAVAAQQDFYTDPKTGYSVMTEYSHKKRGKCCGSGCRHCPFNHVNVKDKASRIQNPAFLYEGRNESSSEDIFSSLSSIPPNSHIKVLFFSGGKDSFLTIRRLVKQRKTSDDKFHLILLTTFDADSRVVAHQEVPISTVERQATHLGIPQLALPLRRGSGETYVSRIHKGIDAIRKRIHFQQLTLVFGDLHLEHIRGWRDEELSPRYNLEYPLWKVPYDELMDDFEASGIRAVLSAVTKDGLKKGMRFNRDLRKKAEQLGMDGFGENGEFHSVAEVWTVSRERALGL